MHELQQFLLSHRWSRLEGGPILLTSQAIGALLKVHILHLRNEIVLDKSPHPLLAHVTQPLVPQLTDIVGCNVHFLPTYPSMEQVQCVDLLGLGDDHVSFAELHCVIPNATLVAFMSS